MNVRSPVDNSTKFYYHPEGMECFASFKYQEYIMNNRVRNVGTKLDYNYKIVGCKME
jgi:hypothetical protein